MKTLSIHLNKNTDNIEDFRELLPNDTKQFFKVHIKQYSYFQRVTTKPHFQSSCKHY